MVFHNLSTFQLKPDLNRTYINGASDHATIEAFLAALE